MIIDKQTNFVYLCDKLAIKFPQFNAQFTSVLRKYGIGFDFIPNTKDIWAVDFMPIQVTDNKFIQFTYLPDYLRNTIKGRSSISDVDLLCNYLSVRTTKSNIILDGGNLSKARNKVVMCDKVFKENPHMPERDLINELELLFEVDKIIFIPTHPHDFVGHADGMLRFLSDDIVLINDYSRESIDFQLQFRMTLHNAGLDYIEIPYNPYSNKNYTQANGTYINYLEMNNVVVVPLFDMVEDELVMKQFETVFNNTNIVSLNGNEIANNGGIFNCITWNILKSESKS